MTFREDSDLQEKSQNATKERNYTPRGNEWLQPTGPPPEMEIHKLLLVMTVRRWIQSEMDRGWI